MSTQSKAAQARLNATLGEKPSESGPAAPSSKAESLPSSQPAAAPGKAGRATPIPRSPAMQAKTLRTAKQLAPGQEQSAPAQQPAKAGPVQQPAKAGPVQQPTKPGPSLAAAPAAPVSQRYQLGDNSLAVNGCLPPKIQPYRAPEQSHNRVPVQSEPAAPERQPLECSPLSSARLAEHTAFEASACASEQPGQGLRVEASCALIGRRGSSRGMPSFLVPVSDSQAPEAGCSRLPEEVRGLSAHITLVETCQSWCLGWLILHTG